MNRNKKLTPFITLLLCGGMLFNAAANASNQTLRVCAASNELPYSNQAKEGFENKLATVLANKMQRKLEFVWSDKAAIYLVSEKLLKKECDVVMGVDQGDKRVATSEPYYQSGYAFIYQEGKGLNISNWKSPQLKKMEKFAITPGSPSEAMLNHIGKYEGNFNYLMSLIGFKSRRNQYVRYAPDMLVSEVVSGKADIAHLWAPEAARYVRNASTPLKMVLSEAVADVGDGEGVQQHYKQSVAVRSEDTALLAEVNQALQKAKSEISAVLKSEGIPVL